MEHAQVKRRAHLWGHLLVTLPAIALIVTVLLFRNYLFVPGWPYYLTTGLALGYQWYTAAMARWRSALAKRGLSENEIEEIAEKGRLVLPGASAAGLFALHTTAAGLCATYLSFWLSGQLVHSIFPLIGQPTPSDAREFHLQHFELMNIVPAVLLGYVVARQFPNHMAWLLPTLVIVQAYYLCRSEHVCIGGQQSIGMVFILFLHSTAQSYSRPIRSNGCSRSRSSERFILASGTPLARSQ
jgi:hypothetical protein